MSECGGRNFDFDLQLRVLVLARVWRSNENIRKICVLTKKINVRNDETCLVVWYNLITVEVSNVQVRETAVDDS